MHKLRKIIEDQIHDVRSNGTPVIVNNQGTLELLDKNFTLSFDEYLDPLIIADEIKKYYNEKGIDYFEILKLEKEEYALIQNDIVNYVFPKFDLDINTRQAIWTSNFCISMIHFIVRNNVIYVFVKFRSSNVTKLLMSDMAMILELAAILQKKLLIKYLIVKVNITSMHEVIIENINERLGDNYQESKEKES